MTFDEYKAETRGLLVADWGHSAAEAARIIAQREDYLRTIWDGSCPRGTPGPPSEAAMAAHLYNVASESIERQKTRKRDLHRDAPAQVRQVLKAAQDSAERGGARKDSAYLSRDDDGS